MRFFSLKYLLIALFVCFISIEMYANDDYYYKVTAKATNPNGAGKVYVSTSNIPDDTDYQEDDMILKGSKNSSSAPTITFSFFTKLNEGKDYNYVQWKSGSTIVNQGALVNGKHSFSKDLAISSKTDSTPTAYTYTPYFYKNYITAQCDGTQCTKVAVSPFPNSLNQNVKLTATLSEGYAIVGWRKMGETDIIAASSRKNPWTVKATEVVTYEPVLEESWVKVSTPDASKCTVAISNANNYQGQTITLSANLTNCYIKHWVNKETGQIVQQSIDETGYGKNPWQLTVTERATYEPVLGDPKVKVQTPDASKCSVSIDKLNNDIGDEVTITAQLLQTNYIVGQAVKFLGWSLNGEIVTTDPQYTFTVAGDATYTAQYEEISLEEGMYCRVKSKYNHTNKYISVVGTSFQTVTSTQWGGTYPFTGAICDKSIQIIPVDGVESDPSTIAYIKGSLSGSELTNTVLSAQGTTTTEIVGSYADNIKVGYNSGYTLYAYVVNNDKYFRHGGVYSNYPEGGSYYNFCAIVASGTSANKWDIEPLNEELMDQYYFGAAPTAQYEGKYYTTMYTGFPYKCYDGVKAFVVTAVSNDGEFEMQEIASGEVPANTPVILQCNSTIPRQNRLVPLKMSPAAIASTNLLKGQIDLNDGKSESSYRKAFNASTMRVLNPETLEFINTNSGETYIKTNTCYLDISSVSASNRTDKYELAIPKTTLAQLIASGDTEGKYTITDLTAVDVVDDELIICKDDNGYANPDAMPNPIPEGETWVDYIAQSKASIEKDLDGREGGPDVAVPATYDQSNWIALHLPEGKHVTSVTDWQGRQLTGVKGRLLNKTNPEFQLDAMPTSGEDVTIAPNVYVAASFNGDNHQQGTKAPFIGTEYFFVQPKPMELATIGWAQWDAANKQFVVPANENQPEWNTAGLSGHFGFNGSLLEQQEGNASLLQDGHSYLMPALIKYKVGGNSQPASAPRRAGEVAKEYVAYPLRLVQTTKEVNGVITGVTAIGGSRAVAGVDYYNLAGQRSSRLWQGVNIVVTRYTDGTTSTCKRIKN